jgi:hypothetical protein
MWVVAWVTQSEMCITVFLGVLVYNIVVSAIKMVTYRVAFAAAFFPQGSEEKYLAHFDSLYDSVNKVYCFQASEKDRKKDNRCFFLHGNGSAAPFFFDGMADRIMKRGHTVIIPEYRGYGNRKDEVHTLTVQNIVEDLVQQWEATMGNVSKGEERILAGVSLGGAFSHQIIDRLNPQPTKVILMNTFSNLWHFVTKLYVENIAPAWAAEPIFINSILWPVYYCCMAPELFHWHVEHGHSSWKGPVSIVHCERDELFSQEHAKELLNHFKGKGCEPVKEHALHSPSGKHPQKVFHHMASLTYDESWAEEF